MGIAHVFGSPAGVRHGVADQPDDATAPPGRAAGSPPRHARSPMLLLVAALSLWHATPAALAMRAPSASAASLAVRSVSNPPARVPRRLVLHVAGSASSVAVYASPGRKLVSGDVRLARSVTVRRGQVGLTVPSSLRAGLWFIVICPPRGRSGCASSHHGMLKAASTFSAPVAAQPVSESAQAASATIGSAGGTLNATAADGTRFRLDIPSGSVPDGTQITMTPLSSLAGAAWTGKLVGAVQFAPEGLLLAHGATLTITPKSRVPVANQVAFGYGAGGGDLHEVPLAPARTAVEIPLAHFSGAGLGNAPGGASAPPTSSATDAYMAQLAAIVAQWREGNLSQGDMEAAAGSVLGAMFKQITSTEVPAGLNDDGAAQQAIGDLMQYARAASVLTGNDNALGQITPILGALLEGIYTRAQTRCTTQHDFSAVSTMISADRSEQLLGLAGHGLAADTQCLSFRVDFESSIRDVGGNPLTGSITLEYVAHPTLTLDLTSMAITGSTRGSFANASGTLSEVETGEDVLAVVSTKPDTFDVKNFCLAGFESSTCTGAQTSIAISIGTPTESYIVPGGQSASFGCWMAGFVNAHRTEADEGMFVLPLHPGSGDLVATATWSQSTLTCMAPATTAAENTTVNVFHTPGG